MKKIGIVTVGLLIAIASTTVVAAVPPTPESYWGYATLDGVPAAIDTPITVEITETGEVVGNTTVVDADGLYSLNVLFDDSETPEDEGATDGDNLTWKINGIICNIPALGTDTASSRGTNDNFNITALHPTPPAPTPFKPPRGGGGGGGGPVTTPTPTVTPTPTPTPTATPTPLITSTPEPIVLGFPVYAVSYVYILLAVLLIIAVVVTIMLLRRRKKRGGRNKEGSDSLKSREMGG